ncbi:hypothetical protein Pan216_04030 [Planctomycetes bacterium Pan216]|uniref:Uncharacterized protein n=1 Tax=Kolteria novifilia TaxID=2527975 RepID=A0A518AXX6_9BACT|nr:hypothetical protein Pan216_04030 [Planctomycetes bacterium Pan216]
MTQHQLDRLVAQATGEDIREIKHLGFSLADPMEIDFDPEPDDFPVRLLDWDNVGLERMIAVVEQPSNVR